MVEPVGKNVACTKIGGTSDISAGQLIDRTGQLLQLPFPSGKHLDVLSQQAAAADLFRVKCADMTFSLSGVQNKVQQYHEKNGIPAETAAYALRCVAFAVFQATKQALQRYPGLPVVFSGGVASNTMLRQTLEPLNPIFAQPQYSTDNAMGVAVLAHPSVYHSMPLARELIAAGRLDGVEIDHPRNTEEDKAELEQLAAEYGLIVTGGTDYHGMNTNTPHPVGTCTTADEQIARIRALAEARKK